MDVHRHHPEGRSRRKCASSRSTNLEAGAPASGPPEGITEDRLSTSLYRYGVAIHGDGHSSGVPSGVPRAEALLNCIPRKQHSLPIRAPEPLVGVLFFLREFPRRPLALKRCYMHSEKAAFAKPSRPPSVSLEFLRSSLRYPHAEALLHCIPRKQHSQAIRAPELLVCGPQRVWFLMVWGYIGE